MDNWVLYCSVNNRSLANIQRFCNIYCAANKAWRLSSRVLESAKEGQTGQVGKKGPLSDTRLLVAFVEA